VTVDVKTKWSAGHETRSQWEPVPTMHCPACGALSVWHDKGPGDYYVGEGHACVSCRHEWTIQGPYKAGTHESQVIDQITASQRA
jgi:hypothetical protein